MNSPAEEKVEINFDSVAEDLKNPDYEFKAQPQKVKTNENASVSEAPNHTQT